MLFFFCSTSMLVYPWVACNQGAQASWHVAMTGTAMTWQGLIMRVCGCQTKLQWDTPRSFPPDKWGIMFGHIHHPKPANDRESPWLLNQEVRLPNRDNIYMIIYYQNGTSYLKSPASLIGGWHYAGLIKNGTCVPYIYIYHYISSFVITFKQKTCSNVDCNYLVSHGCPLSKTPPNQCV